MISFNCFVHTMLLLSMSMIWHVFVDLTSTMETPYCFEKGVAPLGDSSTQPGLTN